MTNTNNTSSNDAVNENNNDNNNNSCCRILQVGMNVRVWTTTTTDSKSSIIFTSSSSANNRISRRACIATLPQPTSSCNENDDDDDGVALILLDDPVPQLMSYQAFVHSSTRVNSILHQSPDVTTTTTITSPSSPTVTVPLFHIIPNDITTTTATTINDNNNGNIIDTNKNEEEEEEWAVPLKDIQPLLDFEQEQEKHEQQQKVVSIVTDGAVMDQSTKQYEILSNMILLYKERGDLLFKMGDVTNACFYYEYALHLTQQKSNKKQQKQRLSFGIGDSILMKRKGYIRVAEIDYIDETNHTIDVCILPIIETSSGTPGTTVSQKEEQDQTIPFSQVLLTIMPLINRHRTDSKVNDCDNNHNNDYIQIRILLNLSRCIMKVATLYLQQTEHQSIIQKKFYQSAILACTMAVSILEYHERNNNSQSTNTNATTTMKINAWLIRSEMYLLLQKDQHANVDCQRILRIDSQHIQGQQLQKKIQKQQKQKLILNKKLSKNVCQWIQTTLDQQSNTTTTKNSGDNHDGTTPATITVSSESSSDNRNSQQQQQQQTKGTKVGFMNTTTTTFLTTSLIWNVIVVLVGVCVTKMLFIR